MKWVALHRDGFCSRLLSFTLSVNDGIAELKASWARPEPSFDEFHTTFPIDERRIEELFSKLRTVELHDSDFLCTDGNSNVLIIRNADAAGKDEIFEFEQFPPWVEFFAWLEEQVIAQLPFPEVAQAGPFN